MRDNKVDWQMFSTAVRFTVSRSRWLAMDNSKGQPTTKKRIKRSWAAMKGFLREIFK